MTSARLRLASEAQRAAFAVVLQVARPLGIREGRPFVVLGAREGDGGLLRAPEELRRDRVFAPPAESFEAAVSG